MADYSVSSELHRSRVPFRVQKHREVNWHVKDAFFLSDFSVIKSNYTFQLKFGFENYTFQ